ncbi:phage holin family protein [Roseobacter denitrificans]|uniref:Integral membrane protein n=1 Tax=Roseobacter denitrificans (strain ATCC 33942 / OCh 114) TaxID=375451 RepID=Q166P9_ROSDO|nr:phage holin family protein [Roseobacter denitrificans]ABG32044.1 conserved hypothetical protein [Roseobacter denitrificans OCh 114]AVL51566.1 phage holin family protein [Roseobacter denitrificans]SFG36773.1 Putative Holin-X, holin superfamily III [Roseobacter denitrificans OCh 114]
MSHSSHPLPSSQPDATDAPALLSDAVARSARLIQSEIELAKREVAAKAWHAGAGIVMIIAAILLVFSALDVLTAAAVAALAEAGVPVSIASLLVAAVAVALAAGLFFAGKSRLASKNLKLKKTARNLRKDANTIKENAHV